jgi:hypothetical protein
MGKTEKSVTRIVSEPANSAAFTILPHSARAARQCDSGEEDDGVASLLAHLAGKRREGMFKGS